MVHEAPVLCVALSRDGVAVVSGARARRVPRDTAHASRGGRCSASQVSECMRLPCWCQPTCARTRCSGLACCEVSQRRRRCLVGSDLLTSREAAAQEQGCQAQALERFQSLPFIMV